MPKFSNPSLKAALGAFHEERSTKNLQTLLEQFISGKVMAPARWDIEPKEDGKGNLVFEPNTKISLHVLSNQNGELYFPMFSDAQSLQDWNADPSIRSLILTFDQLMPFVRMSKDQVKGIVLNPATDNVPLEGEFLIGAADAAKKSRLQPNKLEKGARVYVREPIEDVTDLRMALSAVGEMTPEINAIYLKERINQEDPENLNPHWFVIVDSASDDTKLFEKIGTACRRFMHGKEMEFLFASTKLAQNIIEGNTPVYQKLN
jgi:hypothetical protein